MNGTLQNIISELNSAVWGPPMLAVLLFVGLYLSVRTRFFQIRNLGKSLKSAFLKSDKDKDGLTPFQSACTALSATMGTGNIIGVAGAIALGGAGAVFWMWVSALFSMIIKFSEIVLAVKYREKDGDGFIGGPMYYIKNALPKTFYPLACIFSLCGIIASFGCGNATQINTMSSAVRGVFPKSLSLPQTAFLINISVGIISAVTVYDVLGGGAKRIGRFTEKAVPVMTVIYTVISLGVIIINIKTIPTVFYMIIKGAFNPKSVTGGVVGSVFLSFRRGVARGVFSNEAGLGTAPVAYACGQSDDAVKQGMLGIFEVFVDTVLVCTLTAVVVLSCGNIEYGTVGVSHITLNAFVSVYGDAIRPVFCIVMCFFAFSSVIGWGFYGSCFAVFLFGNKAKKPFVIVFCTVCIIGAVSETGVIWELSEALNGIMSIPNIIAVILLSQDVVKQVKNST